MTHRCPSPKQKNVQTMVSDVPIGTAEHSVQRIEPAVAHSCTVLSTAQLEFTLQSRAKLIPHSQHHRD